MNKNKVRCPKCKSMDITKDVTITGGGKPMRKAFICLKCGFAFKEKCIN